MQTLKAIMGAAVLAAVIAAGDANFARAETVLRFNNVLPPTHVIRKRGWDAWARDVAKATGNRVRIEFTTKALGILPRAFDLARDGVADIGWGVQGYTPGRFISAEVVEVPFLSETAEALSVAYWRVYKKHFEKAAEYKGVHLLGLHTHSPGDVFTAKTPISKLADLRGLKIRVVNRATSQILRSYGGAPVREPAPKVKQLLSKGVIDGTFFTADAINSFRLGEQIRHWLRFSDGLYNTSFFMVVNLKTWNTIPAIDRKAVMSVSGEHFARLMGQLWDESQRDGVKLLFLNGVRPKEPSATQMKALRAKFAGFEANWIRKVEARGIDGGAALKMLRAEVAAYKIK